MFESKLISKHYISDRIDNENLPVDSKIRKGLEKYNLDLKNRMIFENNFFLTACVGSNFLISCGCAKLAYEGYISHEINKNIELNQHKMYNTEPILTQNDVNTAYIAGGTSFILSLALGLALTYALGGYFKIRRKNNALKKLDGKLEQAILESKE